jgi:hypothetical protein
MAPAAASKAEMNDLACAISSTWRATFGQLAHLCSHAMKELDASQRIRKPSS